MCAIQPTESPGSPDYFAANRDLVLAVLRGIAGGVRDVKQRKSEMITFLKSYLDVPEDEAAKSYEFLVSHMPDNMIVDDAVIKKGDGIRRLCPQTEARCRPRHF